MKSRHLLVALLAWVLWHYTESSDMKSYAKGWDVDDAFEDFKTCKAAAVKLVRRRAERMKEEVLDLNAGGWIMQRIGKEPPYSNLIYKVLCLPGGTNPGVVREEAVREEKKWPAFHSKRGLRHSS